MIFLQIANSTIADSDTSDVISKNSVRANELFITFSGYTTTYAEASTQYVCRLTFERSDGTKIQDIATQAKSYTYTDPDTDVSSLYYGYYYDFSNKNVTAVAGTLKLSAKLIRYDSEGNEVTLVTCNTNLNVADNATESTSTEFTITDAQYNALLAAINKLNQPIVVLETTQETIAATCKYLKDISAAKGLYTDSNAKEIYYYNGSDTCTIIGPGTISIYTYDEENETFKVNNTLSEIFNFTAGVIVGTLGDSSNTFTSNIAAYFYDKVFAKKSVRIGQDLTGNADSTYALIVQNGYARFMNDLKVDSETELNGNVYLGDQLQFEPGMIETTNQVSSYPVSYLPYLTNNEDTETVDLHYVTKDNYITLMKSWLGLASSTNSNNGLMSAEDKRRLDVIYAMLGEEEDSDTLVNKVSEILKVFENYTEGTDIVNLLATKLDKSVYDTKVQALDSEIASLQTSDSKMSTKLTSIEEEQEAINTRIDNSQPLQMESRVSTLESKVESLEAKVINDKELIANGNGFTTPTNVLNYVELVKLGGMCYKTSNLLNIADKSSTTTNGITYSISNGVEYLNGTSTALITQFFISNFPLENKIYYLKNFGTQNLGVQLTKSSGGNEYRGGGIIDNSSGTYTYLSLYFQCNSGVTISNTTIKPMLVSGSTAPTVFKPYYSGIRKNLIKGLKVANEDSTIQETTLTSLLTSIASKVSESGYDLGLGLSSSVYNYIDFANKKAIIKCAKSDYASGDEDNSNYLTDGSTTTIKPLSSTIEIDLSSVITSDLDNVFKIYPNGLVSLVNSDTSYTFDNEVPFTIEYQTKGSDSTYCQVVESSNSSDNVNGASATSLTLDTEDTEA